jgi:hypothetical protein
LKSASDDGNWLEFIAPGEHLCVMSNTRAGGKQKSMIIAALISLIILLNPQHVTIAQELLSAEQQLSKLPPVSICITKALNSLLITPSEYKDWQKNIKMSALLPEVELRYGRSSIVVDRFQSTLDNRAVNLSDEIKPRDEYWIFLKWNLPEFAFNRKKIEASEQQINFDHLRVHVVERVTGYYFELRKALKELEKESSKGLNNEKNKGWEEEVELNRARLNALAGNCIGEKISYPSK